MLAVIPEKVFLCIVLFKAFPDAINIIINRGVFFLIVLIISMVFYCTYSSIKWSKTIKGTNYKIVIKYKDIFKMKKCKKIIPFDECYTTSVGYAKGDIKPTSICGQYLLKHPILNMQQLIDAAGLKKAGKSKYQSKDRYESGSLIAHQDYLLMSFVKLDKEGVGRMTRKELIDCLSVMWMEMADLYGQQDVCMPILGSGITKFEDSSLGQQELLDIIIASYKLSAAKIKKPNTLYIVCRREEDFSLNKIGEYM